MEGKQQISRQTAAIVATSTFVGPIPPPDVLRQYAEIKRGQYLAFVVTIVAVSCATACAYFGQSSAACVIAGATLVNLATVFIGRKK